MPIYLSCFVIIFQLGRLTLWGQVTYISTSKRGHHCFRYWAVVSLVQSHYPKQCWLISHWLSGKKIKKLLMLYEWQYSWSQETRFPWNASNRNHRNQWLVNEGETDGVFSLMSDVLILSVPCISDHQLKRISSVYTILKITQFSIIWSINLYYTIAFLWIHGHRIMQRLHFGDIKHIKIRNVPNYFNCRGQCPHTFQIHEWQHNISDPRKVTNVPIFFQLHGSSVPISPKPWQNTVDTLVFIYIFPWTFE